MADEGKLCPENERDWLIFLVPSYSLIEWLRICECDAVGRLFSFHFFRFCFRLKVSSISLSFSCFHATKIGGFQLAGLKKSDIFRDANVFVFNFLAVFKMVLRYCFHGTKVGCSHWAGLKKSDILELG